MKNPATRVYIVFLSALLTTACDGVSIGNGSENDTNANDLAVIESPTNSASGTSDTASNSADGTSATASNLATGTSGTPPNSANAANSTTANSENGATDTAIDSQTIANDDSQPINTESGSNSVQTSASAPTPAPAPAPAPAPEPEPPTVNIDDFLPPTEPVFRGALGFGTFSIAGNFGLPCVVRNLNDHGPESLRDCVERDTSTSVTFDVAGLINLETPLVIASPYINILGQSAPEPGITLTLDRFVDGPVVLVETHDVLMQHLRIRADAALISTCCRDGIFIGNPIPNNVYNVTLDHLSVSWATDELVDIWYDSRDVTVSNSIMSEGLHRSTHEQGRAGRGLLMGADARNVSLYRNLFAHNYQRNPALNGGGSVDMVNNIIYHWVSRGTEISARDQDNRTNVVNNLFISHPADALQPSETDWYDVELNGRNAGDLKVYFEGNIGFWRQDQNQPQWSLAGIDWRTPYNPDVGWHSDSYLGTKFIDQPLDAQNLETALFDELGATLPARDSIDRRVLDEMQLRTGYMPDCVTDCELNARGWPNQ